MKKIILFLMALILVSCNNVAKKEVTEELEYKHELGVAKFKNNPKIVTDFYIGELVVLKENIIGAPLAYKSPAWNLKNIEEIGESVEKIISLKPDLIITINKDKYEQYKDIAPTVYLKYGALNPEETMKEFGKIFNKTDEVSKWQKEFDEKIKSLKSDIKDTSKTYSIMKVWDKDIWAYGNNWGHGGFIIYDKLGLTADSDIQKDVIDSKVGYLNISLENLEKYTGDILLAMDFKNANKITDSEVYKKIVKEKKIIDLNSLDFFHVDPLSLNYQVDMLKKIINE